eukprot:TRINITY_DN4886_c0_g1_i3.p1 TRINITY_DN4886_c0_g1~~TRINITY_DN4886_c0_g1_i3.p1  ORF type:complete len:120 (-),score=47.60 TRINITY_DN4886_c0_g1_i3:62-421(-)
MGTGFRLVFKEQGMKAWKDSGFMSFRGPNGTPEDVHYKFYDDIVSLPSNPVPHCPTVIIHGRNDETVPIELSREYVKKNPHIKLVEVDDDHRLMSSVDVIEDITIKFLIQRCPIEEISQ